MNKKIKTASVLTISAFIFGMYPIQVSAANTVKAVNTANTTTTQCNTSILPCWSIEELISNIVLIMTAGVGILAVGAFVYAGILYTTSAGSPEQTKKAINIITNTVIGIVAYALMYLILNFIVPGGVKLTP